MGKRDREKMRSRAPGARDEVDLILRHVSRQFPRDLARALLRTDAPFEPLGWVDTQVTARQRRLDRALSLKVRDEGWLLHTEWTLAMSGDVPLRVFEYNSLTALALADEARARNDGLRPPSIKSVVVVLSGPDEPWPTHGAYRTSSPGEPFSGVRFRIEPVYQYTVAELEARGSLFWLVFAPLAVDADEDKLERVVEMLRTRTSERDFAELGTAMAVLGFADRRRRGFGDVVEALLPKELTMDSPFFREAKAAGLEQGLAKGRLEALSHQCERRLGRRLKPRERARLSERLRAEGHAKVGDLILDLSVEDLAAWLVKPADAPSSSRRSPGSPRGKAHS